MQVCKWPRQIQSRCQPTTQKWGDDFRTPSRTQCQGQHRRPWGSLARCTVGLNVRVLTQWSDTAPGFRHPRKWNTQGSGQPHFTQPLSRETWMSPGLFAGAPVSEGHSPDRL
jgi:hypothetical protein